MKILIILTSLILLFINQLYAQPLVDWRSYSWLTDDYNTINSNIPQRESDYDWWYDHCTGYENPVSQSGHVGYIACGVSKYRSFASLPISYDERGELINETYKGGCAFDIAPDIPTDDCDYDFSNFENPISGKHGLGFNHIGMINPDGTVGYIITMNLGGEYVRVKQLRDGTYLTVGNTVATRKRNGDIMYYNPKGNGNPKHYFKYNQIFKNNISYSQFGNRGHWDIMKFEGSDGTCLFNFIYGINDFPSIPIFDCASNEYCLNPPSCTQTTNVTKKQLSYLNSGQAVDFVQDKNEEGDIAVVGYITNHKDQKRTGKAAIIKIDTNGKVISSTFLDKTLSGFRSVARAIEYVSINGEDFYYIAVTKERYDNVSGGTATDLQVIKMPINFSNSTPIEIIKTIPSDNSAPWRKQCTAFSIVYENNKLYIPLITDCNNVWWGGDNYGKLQLIAINASYPYDIIYSNPITDVYAYDLKARMIQLFDGNFGVVSSVRKQPWNSIYPTCIVPDYILGVGCPKVQNTNYWNTDAYTAVVKPNLDVIWDKNYDVDTPVNCNDFPVSELNKGGNPKRQECMYGITEGPDKSLVLSGNSSDNYDDNYMIKLKYYPVTAPCPPFESVYTWGPYGSSGDKDLIEEALESYLNSAFPPSNCPSPDIITNVQNVSETKKCDPFPLNNNNAIDTDCVYKEYVVHNQTGGTGTGDQQFPATIITDCELKTIADDAITLIQTGYYCVCQDTYGSIVPEFEVSCVYTHSNSPSFPIKRTICINTTYRCCGLCK